jgi:hypothetical protein
MTKKKLSDFNLDINGDIQTSYNFEALALGTIFIMKQFLKSDQNSESKVITNSNSSRL